MTASLSVSSTMPMPSNENRQGFRLLVIDGDLKLLQLVQQAFQNTGITVYTAQSSGVALRQLYDCRPNLVLLDLLLPDGDSWQVLTYIQEVTDVPVIMTSTVDSAEVIVRALEAGAIDCMIKPFVARIFVARIKSTLRLLHRNPEKPTLAYADAYLRIDAKTQQIWVGGRLIHLTTNERKLLLYLISHANQVCSYADLLEHVWSWEYRESTQYIHVYVSQLRKKIEPTPNQPRYFHTVHGIGYQFQDQR